MVFDGLGVHEQFFSDLISVLTDAKMKKSCKFMDRQQGMRLIIS
jgi:hypothetical protein